MVTTNTPSIYTANKYHKKNDPNELTPYNYTLILLLLLLTMQKSTSEEAERGKSKTVPANRAPDPTSMVASKGKNLLYHVILLYFKV